MNDEFLYPLDVTDEDIDWVEEILQGVFFDNCRREIIKNMATVDIQAFPGSGKTTALVAKLAILAKKWSFPHYGICVLSHTNAAREEIEHKLGNTAVGKKLLRYPHFIGTFQSFFDIFVSIPWLRSHGINIKMIDSELVKESRWNRLNYGTRNFLKRKYNTNDCCQASSLPVKIGVKGVLPHTETYKKLVGVVEGSSQVQNVGVNSPSGTSVLQATCCRSGLACAQANPERSFANR